ncbi:MAG TPA: PIN domain-containing protein [Candidatus Lokiarchaeia archaeon]|nr:PIN domain-containing protein [Candidatus Lokiarchaeia archaeon]
MAILIDTSGIIATRNKDDADHGTAVKAMRAILQRKHGETFITDYIFDEAVTIALVRTKNPEFANDIGNFILNTKLITKIQTTQGDFHEAWLLFQEYMEKRLSFTDCTLIAIARRLGIENIFSFDSHFDGILTRIH